MQFGWVARQADEALGGQVVTLIRVANLELGNPAKDRRHGGLVEKGRLAPDVLPPPGRQPQIDLVQMALSVVTGNALRVEPQEKLCGPDGLLVAGVLMVHF